MPVDRGLPVGRGPSTIIRSTSTRLQAPGVIADNHKDFTKKWVLATYEKKSV